MKTLWVWFDTCPSMFAGTRTSKRYAQSPLLNIIHRPKPVPWKGWKSSLASRTVKRTRTAVFHPLMFQNVQIQYNSSQRSHRPPILSPLPVPLLPRNNDISIPSLHRNPPPASHSQRHPTANQRHTTQRRNRPHNLEALRIQHKQIDRTAKHRHARRQQRFPPDLLLAGESCLDGYQGDGVDELKEVLGSRLRGSFLFDRGL
jgi:hypothetical protein